MQQIKCLLIHCYTLTRWTFSPPGEHCRSPFFLHAQQNNICPRVFAANSWPAATTICSVSEMTNGVNQRIFGELSFKLKDGSEIAKCQTNTCPSLKHNSCFQTNSGRLIAQHDEDYWCFVFNIWVVHLRWSVSALVACFRFVVEVSSDVRRTSRHH